MDIIINKSKKLDSLKLLSKNTNINLINGINLILMGNGTGKTRNASVLHNKLKEKNIDTKFIKNSKDLIDMPSNNFAAGKDFLIRLEMFSEKLILEKKAPILIIDDILGFLDICIIKKILKILLKNNLQIIIFVSHSILTFLNEDTKSLIKITNIKNNYNK